MLAVQAWMRQAQLLAWFKTLLLHVCCAGGRAATVRAVAYAVCDERPQACSHTAPPARLRHTAGCCAGLLLPRRCWPKPCWCAGEKDCNHVSQMQPSAAVIVLLSKSVASWQLQLLPVVAQRCSDANTPCCMQGNAVGSWRKQAYTQQLQVC